MNAKNVSSLRVRRPKPLASHEPHACVILAIDPGASSGWAIFDGGRLVTCGHAQTQDERIGACLLAEVTAGGRGARAGAPLVVVAEKWTANRSAARDARMNAQTNQGLGQAWGLWLAAIETELELPKRRVLRVAQSTWKAKVLGRANWKHGVAVEIMRTLASRHGAPSDAVEDVHAAVCIGLWAVRAGEVGRALPKPRARKTTISEAA